MAAKKPTRKKKPSRARKPLGAGARARSALARIEAELNLREFSRQVQRGLSRLEKQIESAQRDARRRWTRLLRDVSHQLGGLEGQGERRWREQGEKARREAVRLLQRLEKAIGPAKKPARRASAARPARRPAGAGPAAARPASTAAPARPPLPAAPVRPASPPSATPPAPLAPRPFAPTPRPEPASPAPPGPPRSRPEGGGIL